MVTWAMAEKMNDIRPLISALNDLDRNDIPKAWTLYKEQLRSVDQKDLPVSTGSTSGSLISSVTSTLQQLVGGAGSIASSRKEFTSIDRLEKYCADTRKVLDREYKKLSKNLESQRKEQEEMIQKQIEEIKNSDLKLIDYIMGNVPQPGQPSQSITESK